MCITRLLFFFKSHPVRNIEQPVRIPPDGPGSVVPPSSVPRPGQPAHSPGDAAGRTRRTEDRRVGQVRPLGRKSRHTHTHTRCPVRKGEVTVCRSLSQTSSFPRRSPAEPTGTSARTWKRVQMCVAPWPSLGFTHWWRDGGGGMVCRY